MDIIRTQGLTKSFRPNWPGQPRIHVLDGLSLSVMEGEIFGFLGHNGAGKTTTIKLLLGLLHPSAGTAWILDRPITDVEVRRYVGYLPESPFFYEYLTAEEFLVFYGQLFGMRGATLMKKVDELLELVSMADARRVPLRKFSKGMLQRVGIAQALINDPRLVILDEPMSGLDPIGRRDVRNIILRLKAEGKTVFFSSHILPDVEMICDRIGIMVKGRLKSVGTVQELIGAGSVTSVEILAEGVSDAHLGGVEELGGSMLRQGSQVLVTLPDETNINRTVDLIRANGGRLVSVVPHKRSLEDLFLREAGLGRS